MSWTVEAAAYGSAIASLAGGVSYVLKRHAKRGSDQEEWTRKLVDEQMAKRESERADCTQRIEGLTARIDAVEERASVAEAKVDACEEKHRRTLDDRVNDIAARHAIVRQLRDITAKYEDLRGIVDSIEEIPRSNPPPRIGGM